MLFIHYPKCSTCQKAKAYLEERGLTPSWEELDLLAAMDESDTL